MAVMPTAMMALTLDTPEDVQEIVGGQKFIRHQHRQGDEDQQQAQRTATAADESHWMFKSALISGLSSASLVTTATLRCQFSFSTGLPWMLSTTAFTPSLTHFVRILHDEGINLPGLQTVNQSFLRVETDHL